MIMDSGNQGSRPEDGADENIMGDLLRSETEYVWGQIFKVASSEGFCILKKPAPGRRHSWGLGEGPLVYMLIGIIQ